MVFVHATNGDLTAVLTHIGHARLSIPLYGKDHVLQSTLSYTFQENQVDATVTRLLFVGPDHLVAVLEHTRNTATTSTTTLTCIVWNVVRGVVIHTMAPESLVDVTASDTFVYFLTISKSKLYVLEHSILSGKLLRKIKAGKIFQTEQDQKQPTPSALAITVSGDKLAVRNGPVVKVLLLSDGSKHSKCKLGDTDATTAVAVQVVMKGTLLATVMDAGIGFFHVDTGKRITTLPLSEPPTTTLQLLHYNNNNNDDDDNNYQLLLGGTLSTLTDNNITTTCQFDSPTDTFAVYPGTDHSHWQSILLDPKTGVTFHTVSCINGHGHPLSRVSITPPVDNNVSSTIDTTRKRSITTTLGPGQAGGEHGVMDEQSKQKKVKKEEGGADPDLDEPTVAERLKQLAEELDIHDDDDDNDHVVRDGLDFEPNRATTESLAKVLHQALFSGDDPMLELALGVKDKTVMTTSLKELDADEVSLLLTKLTTRLSNKPTRAADLVVWIGSILATGKIREANQLRPLRNLLQERVESFPHLLQLEGRLSMLASM